jgi:DNA polymerase I
MSDMVSMREVMPILQLVGITRVLTIDTEFRLDENYRQHVVCVVAHQYPNGHTHRIWLDGNQQPFQLPCDEDTLWVSYVATAELRSMLALGHPLPKHVLDLYVENRWLHNIQESKQERKQKQEEKFFGLATTLRRFGCYSIGNDEKEAMRDLILRGGLYTEQQQNEILDYCESDVNGLDALLPKMLPQIDIRRAIARGTVNLTESAKIEDRGVPMDVERLEAIRNHSGDLIRHIISKHPQIDVYDGTTFSQKKFEVFLQREGLARDWKKTDTGIYSSENSYLEKIGEHCEIIEELRQLKKIILQLQRDRFCTGADGRARCPLWPFSSVTGRNQPAAGKDHKDGIRSESPFVFGLPKSFRFLIRPTTGMALAYIDWEQQEFAIAALMSGDKEMVRAYKSGNPYLALAKKLGAVPESATKDTHRLEHEKYKAVVLGVNYGRTKQGLSKVLGLPTNECAKLLRGYWKTFSTYAGWRKTVRMLMLGYGRLWVWDGWQCLLGVKPNVRSVLNWPVQSTGAVILRLAIVLAARKGVRIIAPVHDALLIESPAENIDEHVRLATEAMDEACRAVLGDVIRTEHQIIRADGRFYDEKGKKLWDVICSFMGWEQPQSNEPEKATHTASS